jgi:hypothetical protein
MTRWLMALLAVLVVAGCQADGGAEEVWDLRTSHRLADVGWPEDLRRSEHTVDGTRRPVRVLLPGDVEVDDAHRLFANLPPGAAPDPDDPLATPLESVGINFPEEDIGAALARAERIAEAWGADVANPRAAARPGGGIAHSQIVELGDDGVGQVSLRARGDGTGYAWLEVAWGVTLQTLGAGG